MAPELSEILPVIQSLPLSAKEELYLYLGDEIKKTRTATVPADSTVEPFIYDPANPSIGLMHDEPELADEIVRLAMEMRERQPWSTPSE